MRRISYFALGGTIASVKGDGQGGAVPSLSAADLASAASVGRSGLSVDAIQFIQVPSPEITTADLLRLRTAIGAAVDEGACGVVVSQGTDTLEESAFLIDLLWDRPEPVVFTGAMRNPSLPGNDGPANLQAALAVAASEAARSCGVLAAFNDEIHAARFVQKTHTSNPATFRSPGLGPIGSVTEARVSLPLRPGPRLTLPMPTAPDLPQVAIWSASLGDDGRLLDAVVGAGYRGLVVQAFGGGHVRSETVPRLVALSERMPVVLTSRTRGGEVLTSTYGFPGGEIDLMARGLISGGDLDGYKARLLLSLCIAHGMDRAGIAAIFGGFAGH